MSTQLAFTQLTGYAGAALGALLGYGLASLAAEKITEKSKSIQALNESPEFQEAGSRIIKTVASEVFRNGPKLLS